MPQDFITQLMFQILPIGLIIYFLIFRPHQKQQKKMKDMISNLKKNDVVVTTSGMHGEVAIVKEKTVVIRVDEGCRIEFDKESIASVKSNEVKPELVK